MTLSDVERLALKYRTPLYLLIGAVLYIALLGLRDVWYPDEPDIAEVARAMFLSGDWIHPRRMGEIWVDYPPMIYWIGTLSSHLLGGMSAFSLRLPNALAALATVLIVGYAGKRWFDDRTGLWSGLALLTFLEFVYEGNSYRPDVMFALTITAGMLLYAEGSGDRPRLLLRTVAFACFGLAMLSKGPLGLLLPGLVLVLWQASRREWLRILEMAPLALVSLGLYVPWFVATAEGMGWSSMLYEFYAQNFERFLTSENRGHGQPWYYYLRNFWPDFLPWSFLFPAALWWLLRSGRHRDERVRLVLIWFVTFFIFLSTAATKRQLYLLPAYPAVALLLGPWLAAVGRQGDIASPDARPVRLYALLLGLLYAVSGVALFIAVSRLGSIIAAGDFSPEELAVGGALPLPLAILGAVLLLGGGWIAHAGWRGLPRRALVRLAAVHIVIYVVALGVVMPTFGPVKSYREPSVWISDTIGDETAFGMVHAAGALRRGGFAYYTDTMVPLLETPDDVREFFEAHPTSLVLINTDHKDMFFEGDEAAYWTPRIMREIHLSRHTYIVVSGPETH